MARAALLVAAALAARGAAAPACGAPLPEANDRVAVVVRGESFRGLNNGAFIQEPGLDTHALRAAIICTPSSREIQRSLAKNHVDLLVKPLERRGVAVRAGTKRRGAF